MENIGHADRMRDDRMNSSDLRLAVQKAVEKAKIVDVHTHLYPPCCDKLLLRGVDDLLTYHYLTVETLRYGEIGPEKFFSLSKHLQADIIWDVLFERRSPVSEACRGILTTLNSYGLDPTSESLGSIRQYFSELSLDEHVNLVLEKSGVDTLVMTNNPFDEEEEPHWGPEFISDSRFKTALRIDDMLNSPQATFKKLEQRGYKPVTDTGGLDYCVMRKFLLDCANRIEPVYLAASLPPGFDWSEDAIGYRVLKNVVLPCCEERGLPIALMIGVKKLINPVMGLGGDGVGCSPVEAVAKLCLENPSVKFMVTMLARENQHELAVTARKFPNLTVFGCWWFLNNPSLVEEITRMRVELLGLSFIPQHSDARVLDQLIYKWKHSKGIIAEVLYDKYADLAKTGWQVSAEDIGRDVEMLFSGNAKELTGIK